MFPETGAAWLLVGPCGTPSAGTMGEGGGGEACTDMWAAAAGVAPVDVFEVLKAAAPITAAAAAAGEGGGMDGCDGCDSPPV